MPTRLRSRNLLALAPFVAALGCGAPTSDPREGGPQARDEATPLSVCEDGSIDARPGAGFRHASSAVIAVFSRAHASDDVVAVSGGDAARVRAKLAYGPTSKDLEDEWVEVRIDDCAGGTRSLGFHLTDDDGRIDAKIDADDLPDPGRYRLTMRVWGDATTVAARLFVVPKGTEVAVFDVDGTLTTSDLQLYEDLVHDLFAPVLAGDFVPKARGGAAEMTRLRARQGYLPVFLTGRPYWLTARTRAWLDAIDAAPGVIELAPHTADAWPTNAGVGAFKADALADLELAGLAIAVAYGNAKTDAFAYDEAGVPPERVFMLDGEGDYDALLEDAEAEPGPAVPLLWP